MVQRCIFFTRVSIIAVSRGMELGSGLSIDPLSIDATACMCKNYAVAIAALPPRGPARPCGHCEFGVKGE